MNISTNLPAAKGCLVGGRWISTADTIPVLDPSTGEVFATISAGGKVEIDAAVAAARVAFDGGAWSKLTATERGRLLSRLADAITANADELAQTEARDTGKPMTQARADMIATARYFEFYGGAADKVHGETIPFLDGYNVQVWHEPHGVTGHIIPWNYPAQMFARSLAPALAMGNAVVLKPAEEASLTPLRLAELAMEVGFPAGSINVVPGYGEAAGQALTSSTDVDFLSFTGSPEVGVMIQMAAAKNHIGCTLELGGKSPQIVFEDADLERALPVLVGAIVQNGGQTCSAGSRALIQRSIWDEVVQSVTARFENLTAAPFAEDQNLGPLISETQCARVHAFIERAKANLIVRGTISQSANEAGFFVAPALYGPVDEDDELARDEVFGPVLSLIPFDDEADAIRIANDTDYGLVAGIWTENAGRQTRMAKAMRCGQVFLNGYGAGGGIELPFGGVRKSGHGREKGFAALYEFSQTKTVVQDYR